MNIEEEETEEGQNMEDIRIVCLNKKIENMATKDKDDLNLKDPKMVRKKNKKEKTEEEKIMEQLEEKDQSQGQMKLNLR
jgi:hypothetical protein